MRSLVACRQITSGSVHKCKSLRSILGHQTKPDADSIPVADRPNQVDQEPVISVSLVAENNCWAIIAVDGNVDKAVVVEVSECSAAGGDWDLKCRTALRRYIAKSTPVVSQQNRRFEVTETRLRQFDVIHHVAL